MPVSETQCKAPCKEWTKGFLLIDYQGQSEECECITLFEYQKIYDSLLKISSAMSESNVRNEIVRLVQLKHLPTHDFNQMTCASFDFVRVYNKKVRQIDGDVPFEGTGVTHMYRHGSVYVSQGYQFVGEGQYEHFIPMAYVHSKDYRILGVVEVIDIE